MQVPHGDASRTAGWLAADAISGLRARAAVYSEIAKNDMENGSEAYEI